MMTPEEKELRSIYNYYKDTKMGFFTKDGYACRSMWKKCKNDSL